MIHSYMDLDWKGPFLFNKVDFNKLPTEQGVYLFTESPLKKIKPNAALPVHGSAGREGIVKKQRSTNCILYIGMTNEQEGLRGRLPGYRLADGKGGRERHKGRALLHGYQYKSDYLYLWYATVDDSYDVETLLIHELHPVLNTMKRIDDTGARLRRRDQTGPRDQTSA